MPANLSNPIAPTPLPSQLNFTVTVAPNNTGGATFTYTSNGEPVPTPLITVPPATVVIIAFTLAVGSGEFQSINWLQPATLPASVTSTAITIADYNSGSGTAVSFGFTLSVQLDGQVYTSPDPTIINNPIGN